MENLAQFEADLWEAADNLRANSKLTSSDYFMPVLGVIFLRHAANRFDAATKQIADDQAAGRMPKRKVQPADYIRRRALWLPQTARYDYIMEKASVDPAGLPKLVTGAMTAIEADFEALSGVLPKDYGIFEPKVLEDLMRLFNSEQIKHATGDVFGRIYEYFLAKFSIQKAHDNGEFFTPSSLVQTIVNVIEPDHGIVFDPAIGSAGMAVQSSHFIEDHGGDTSRQVVIYGQEKNRDTIRIAKMNLAVHGLEGKIAEAITYYQDEHNLVGKCDFVMANPPFNVDLVDAERIAKDPRLPFGLPGVNKGKKVSNGNYLWISYFWSYLSDKGRAGFVMSSQASSAGNDEKEVRKKIIETGDVDVMIAIKSGFFYTRTVSCELWHFDRTKPEDRKDKVLMLDARSMGQLMKGSRKVYEFSPEQMRDISAIVWLYRGQRDRFLALVKDYFTRLCTESAAVSEKIAGFSAALEALDADFAAIAKAAKTVAGLDVEKCKLVTETLAEQRDAAKAYTTDLTSLLSDLAAFVKSTSKTPPATNDKQHAARKAFDPYAERSKGLIKQLDLLYKLAYALLKQGALSRAVEESRREALTREMEWLRGQAQWLETTIIEIIISEAQNEVRDFKKWDFDIIPHRVIMKNGFETPDGKRLNVEDAFKEPNHPFRVAIVCAMWLTGFDVECLQTLYIDKPMKAHTLMQAIARANRVYPGKTEGLIVDYNGMLKSLREALAQYALGDDDGQPAGGGDGGGVVTPIEEYLAAFLQALEAAENHLRGLGFDPSRLLGAKGFSRTAALRDAVDALYTSDEAKRRFEIMAREVFSRFKALLMEPSALRYAVRHDDVETIYKKLQERRDIADVTEVLKELQEIVSAAIRAQEPGGDQMDSKLCDMSRIDFAKLRDEFAKKVKRKAAALQDIRDVVEEKLAQMLAQNPQRMDFYKKYQEIIADYNREKDRVTIEETFGRLVDFAAGLDAAQKQAAEEGLSQDEYALFQMLFKDTISKADRERLKLASRDLLAALITHLRPMPNWTKNTQTQADVKMFILDNLYASLPRPPFSEEETDTVAARIYDFVWQRSSAGALFTAAA